MNLVIVESPAKAKTINKYLGKNYKVLASYGHVRDLPSKNGSVDPENNFELNSFLFITFVIILYTHRQNIVRLKNKTEDKIKL